MATLGRTGATQSRLASACFRGVRFGDGERASRVLYARVVRVDEPGDALRARRKLLLQGAVSGSMDSNSSVSFSSSSAPFARRAWTGQPWSSTAVSRSSVCRFSRHRASPVRCIAPQVEWGQRGRGTRTAEGGTPMSRGRVGVVLAVVGAAVLVLSALADVIGVGGENDAFGSRQVIGVIVGAVILVPRLTRLTGLHGRAHSASLHGKSRLRAAYRTGVQECPTSPFCLEVRLVVFFGALVVGALAAN